MLVSWQEGAHHTPESFLTRCVPQLQTHFDTVHVDLLGHEKCAARRGCVLRVELVLCVALKEAGFADAWDVRMSAVRDIEKRRGRRTRVAHNDDLAIYALVVPTTRVGVDGGIAVVVHGGNRSSVDGAQRPEAGGEKAVARTRGLGILKSEQKRRTEESEAFLFRMLSGTREPSKENLTGPLIWCIGRRSSSEYGMDPSYCVQNGTVT